MCIEEINWLDTGGEEAVLKVVSDTDCLECFSCPCSCDVGDVLTEPLECLNTNNIMPILIAGVIFLSLIHI